MFENPEIAPADLPAADELEWRALDRRYVRRLQIQALMSGLTVFVGLAVVNFLPLPITELVAVGLAPVVLAAVVAAGVVWPVISVPKKGYAIRDRDVIYKSGVLWRSVSAVPFNRVQHVETSSTPLDRRYRLATLQLYTAGGAGGDLKIHGLPADIAENLRLFVLERVGGETEQV